MHGVVYVRRGRVGPAERGYLSTEPRDGMSKQPGNIGTSNGTRTLSISLSYINLTNSHPVIVVSRNHYICQRSTTDLPDCISSKVRHEGNRKRQPTNVKTLINENLERSGNRKPRMV